MLALLTWKYGLVPASESDWWLYSQCSSTAKPYVGKTQRAKCHTVDEAKQAASAALTQLNRQDFHIVFDIISDVRIEHTQGKGMSAIEAAEDASRLIPQGAFDVTEFRTIKGCTQRSLKCEAYSDGNARDSAEKMLLKGVRIDKATCESEPKRGILGIGRKPGQWSVQYTTPLEGELHYKLPAEVRAVAIPKSGSSLTDLRQHESMLVNELERVSTIAENDRSALESESRRNDFLVKMVPQSMQSGLKAKEIYAQRPMNWPDYLRRDLDRVRQRIAIYTLAV